LTIYVDKYVEIIPTDPASLSLWTGQDRLKTLHEESGIPDLVFYDDEDIAAGTVAIRVLGPEEVVCGYDFLTVASNMFTGRDISSVASLCAAVREKCVAPLCKWTEELLTLACKITLENTPPVLLTINILRQLGLSSTNETEVITMATLLLDKVAPDHHHHALGKGLIVPANGVRQFINCCSLPPCRDARLITMGVYDMLMMSMRSQLRRGHEEVVGEIEDGEIVDAGDQDEDEGYHEQRTTQRGVIVFRRQRIIFIGITGLGNMFAYVYDNHEQAHLSLGMRFGAYRLLMSVDPG
jgi:hypothetical protein